MFEALCGFATHNRLPVAHNVPQAPSPAPVPAEPMDVDSEESSPSRDGEAHAGSKRAALKPPHTGSGKRGRMSKKLKLLELASRLAAQAGEMSSGSEADDDEWLALESKDQQLLRQLDTSDHSGPDQLNAPPSADWAEPWANSPEEAAPFTGTTTTTSSMSSPLQTAQLNLAETSGSEDEAKADTAAAGPGDGAPHLSATPRLGAAMPPMAFDMWFASLFAPDTTTEVGAGRGRGGPGPTRPGGVT